MTKRVIVTRHSKKAKKGERQYGGLSYEGIKLAQRAAKNILYDLEKSPEGSVMFLGGVSDQERTRTTAEVYGKELKRLLKDNEGYIVITKDDLGKGKGYSEIAKDIKYTIESNPDKKIIVDIPLSLKEMSLQKRGWVTKEGKHSEYIMNLIKENDMDEYKAMRAWLTSQGEGGGPNPNDVAKDYKKGVDRLEKLAKKYTGNRPLITGLIGHCFEADAYLTSLIGEVNIENFDKISKGKGEIKETEKGYVKINPAYTTMEYRGEETKGKTLDSMIKVIMALSLGGVLYPFFSKPSLILIGEKVQLAPPLPNYLIYVFAAMFIGGAVYFLIKKLKK